MFFNLISSCFSISLPVGGQSWYRHNYLSECANFSEKHTEKLKKVRRISKLIQRCLISVGIEWRRGKHSSTLDQNFNSEWRPCVCESPPDGAKWCCSRAPPTTTTLRNYFRWRNLGGAFFSNWKRHLVPKIFKYTRRQITTHLFDCLASNHSSQSKQAGKTKVWKVIRFRGTKHWLNSSFIRLAMLMPNFRK